MSATSGTVAEPEPYLILLLSTSVLKEVLKLKPPNLLEEARESWRAKATEALPGVARSEP